MFSKEFATQFPDFRHHFVEFRSRARAAHAQPRLAHRRRLRSPTRVLSRRARRSARGEFYQVLSEALQANYPVTAGLMPWVFKRPWPVVAIQLMDGFGHPTAPYYFLKRTYEETHVLVRLPHLLWTAGESIPLKAAVTHANIAALAGLTLSVEVQDDAFRSLWQQTVHSVAETRTLRCRRRSRRVHSAKGIPGPVLLHRRRTPRFIGQVDFAVCLLASHALDVGRQSGSRQVSLRADGMAGVDERSLAQTLGCQDQNDTQCGGPFVEASSRRRYPHGTSGPQHRDTPVVPHLGGCAWRAAGVFRGR